MRDARLDVLARVARTLRLSGNACQVSGWIAGQHVTASYGEQVKGVTVGADLLPPIDLGLSVCRKPRLSPVNTGYWTPDMQTGDAALDSTLSVHADDAERVQALLFHAQLRAELLDVARLWKGAFGLEDERASIFCSWGWLDDNTLIAAFGLVASIANLVADARRAVPCASKLRQHEPTWRRVAEERALELQMTPFHVSGRSGNGLPMGARAWRRDPLEYTFEAAAGYGDALGRNLFVRPAAPMDAVRTFFGAQDVELGDPSFDREFVIQAGRVEGLEGVLEPELRSLILDVNHTIGTVALHDDRVSLRSPSLPQSVDELSRALDAVVEIATRMAANSHPVVSTGPYR